MIYKRSKEQSDKYHKNHVEKYGREHLRQRDRDYYKKNREHLLECRRKNNTKEKRDKKSEQSRIKRKELKDEILKKLGEKCIQCGFDDKRALQIDHINGDGHEERDLQKSTNTYYRHVIRSIENNEGKYQLLCANCNWIKRIEHNETH